MRQPLWNASDGADGRRGRGVFKLGRDGEIKGPGPFWSKALVVLKNFRDLTGAPGPGFCKFLSVFKGLSGTLARDGRNV